MTVSFVVLGKPQPAGSKRGFQHRSTGRVMVVDAAKGSRAWKQEVAGEALRAMTYHADEGTSGYYPPLEGPLEVRFTFFVERPKSHYGAKGLKPSAPASPTTRPDLLKLARAIEDSMNGIVYGDDSQIVWELLEKRYGVPARVEVQVAAHE